jgi:hypothetical protein
MEIEPVSSEFYDFFSTQWDLEQKPSKWKEFIEILRNRVQELYQNEPEKLLQILYRLDVPEEQFIYATQLENFNDKIDYLTQKIVERELKRYEFRKNYKG